MNWFLYNIGLRHERVKPGKRNNSHVVYYFFLKFMLDRFSYRFSFEAYTKSERGTTKHSLKTTDVLLDMLMDMCLTKFSSSKLF